MKKARYTILLDLPLGEADGEKIHKGNGEDAAGLVFNKMATLLAESDDFPGALFIVKDRKVIDMVSAKDTLLYEAGEVTYEDDPALVS